MSHAAAGIRVNMELTTVVNYALQQNRVPVLRELVIRNDTPLPLAGLTLGIRSEPEIVNALEQNIELIPGQTAVSPKDLRLTANGGLLAGLTERLSGVLHVTLSQGEAVLATETRELTALAFDEWQGTAFFPELLAAFVTPNHPEIVKINAAAAELLEKWTGDPSLNAYQTREKNRVLAQAAAIYGALQALNIVYSVPPASFEAVGQRVRLCDAVLGQKLGTCMDLTLLYAACLEAAGLRPLLLLQEGHIFAGLWLEELSFPEAVQDDPALITKRLADGIQEIAVVECTALTAGRNIGFDRAMAAAAEKLKTPAGFEYIIDVGRARLSGIRPLPLRVPADGGWTVEKEARGPEELTAAPAALGAAVPVTEGTAPLSPDKLTQWERRLLDLGLRNTLLNMRMTQSVVPILSPSLVELEDALADGGEYAVGPRPMEWPVPQGGGDSGEAFESVSSLGPVTELIHSEFQSRRLRSVLGEGDLARAMVALYRSSKLSLEENGANTLYLALGLLRWYETKTSQKPRYAPVVLLPVEILRKAANRGYVIRLRDDEPQMNITLLEMLRQDYGVSVSGLDPLPLDEQGIDLRAVFAALRKAVMDQDRWDIVESAFLGIFSFSQFVMWNDIRNRTEELRQNKIVRSLMEGKLAWAAEPMELGERVPEDNVLLPIPADASQLYAIHAAARGESFVLHGPPGTGKSQTITALIVNALAQEKTVLFVAEKMAALSVVQKRLNALGIGPFCLELHSNKSKKRDVLEQLRQATEVTRLEPAPVYAQKAQQAAGLRRELDDYAAALHRPRRSGLTLYDMISRWERYRDTPDAVAFSPAFAADADAALLERQRLLVERLAAAARAVGHPAGHPLRPVGRAAYSQQLRTALPEHLRRYGAALEALEQAGIALSGRLALPCPASRPEWENLRAVAGELAVWALLPRPWAGYEDLPAAMADVREMARRYAAAIHLWEVLSRDWKEEFLRHDAAGLLAQWDSAGAQWFLPKVLNQNKLVRLVAPHAKSGVRKEALPEAFGRLAACQRELAAAHGLFDRYGADLGPLYVGDNSDWGNIAVLAAKAVHSGDFLARLTGGNALRQAHAADHTLFPAVEALNRAYDAALLCREELYGLLELWDGPEDGKLWLAEQKTLCEALSARAGELRDWMSWNSAGMEAAEAGLETVVRAYESGFSHEEVPAAYEKALYMALIEDTVERDDALRLFSGAVFNEKIAQFKRLDRELSELAKTEAFCRLAAKVPNFTREAAQSSEVGILQRAIRSGGRGVSIRRLFEQIPNLLPRLCPCMLMSPISAAQYLDPRRPPFDIVVFDEASQMPTSKAVGALARGRDAVVVGDPKQMPPTSFFVGSAAEEENLDCEDLESILDDCLALNMPETHLLWHYRSRHESLIAFSNSQFYENRLLTFPSVNDRASKVSLVPVAGMFDRGRTRQNREEAQAVVRELVRRQRDPRLSGQSVGVVTFNISQQNLIDDLFTEACRGDPALEAWAYEAEEPLFIKNLENVQGDERDVILFSIGYGPDAQGRVFMNFGPLNREGGWRRLNVAVSRARQEMAVFSALTADQIDLSRSAASGVAALKAFLDYAGGGAFTKSPAVLADAQTDSIAQAVCLALERRGYRTQRPVGHSAYRLDIGVVDAKNPERYLLGILLDGPVYGRSRTTRDRELAQAAVLNGLGWELHRIWAVDWWDNSARELDALQARLRALEEKRDMAELPPSQPGGAAPAPAPRPEESYREASAPPVQPPQAYRAAVLPPRAIPAEEYVLPQRSGQIEAALRNVVQAEAPISEGLLTRRVLQSFGIARAGAKIQTRTEEILSKMRLKSTVQNGQRFYWARSQAPDAYGDFRASGEGDDRRDPRDLPVQEAAAAARAVLREQIGLPREDLIREMAKLLGYSRSGNVVAAAMSEGIDYAVARGIIGQEPSGNLKVKN